MVQVAITKANVAILQHDIEDLLDLLQYRPSKKRILLKPNIVVASAPEMGDITHPEVIKALVMIFKKAGAEVVVAEGTGIFGTDEGFEKLLQATGYDLIRDELGVPFINLERAETRKVPWKYGLLSLPRILDEYEYVNVPTMKTHLQTGVTLGIKNQKGLIPLKTKKIFHKKDLHACIYELSQVIKPSLTVMDCMYCIEGTGPIGPPIGEVKRMNLIVGGKDMMAVDNVCAQIMGFNVEEIKHLKPIPNIEVIGEKIEDHISEFKRPVACFKKDHFVLHMDEKACTMCTVSTYQAISKINHTPELKHELGSRKDLREIDVILGPTVNTPTSGSCTLCVGDCATKIAHKSNLPLIKGCHPDYRKIINFLFPEYYSGVEE